MTETRRRRRRSRGTASRESFGIKVIPFGLQAPALTRFVRELHSHSGLARYRNGHRIKLLHVEPLQLGGDRKLSEPRTPTACRATFYDYTDNRALLVEGKLDSPKRAKLI